MPEMPAPTIRTSKCSGIQLLSSVYFILKQVRALPYSVTNQFCRRYRSKTSDTAPLHTGSVAIRFSDMGVRKLTLFCENGRLLLDPRATIAGRVRSGFASTVAAIRPNVRLAGQTSPWAILTVSDAPPSKSNVGVFTFLFDCWVSRASTVLIWRYSEPVAVSIAKF